MMDIVLSLVVCAVFLALSTQQCLARVAEAFVGHCTEREPICQIKKNQDPVYDGLGAGQDRLQSRVEQARGVVVAARTDPSCLPDVQKRQSAPSYS